MSGFFFALDLWKSDFIRTIIVYGTNAYSPCSFDLLDNNWSHILNLHYPSKDESVTLFGFNVVSFISSVNIINIIQAFV